MSSIHQLALLTAFFSQCQLQSNFSPSLVWGVSRWVRQLIAPKGLEFFCKHFIAAWKILHNAFQAPRSGHLNQSQKADQGSRIRAQLTFIEANIMLLCCPIIIIELTSPPDYIKYLFGLFGVFFSSLHASKFWLWLIRNAATEGLAISIVCRIEWALNYILSHLA